MSLTTFAAMIEHHRRSSLGSGKFVVMLASNLEGGVMEVKSAREWELERKSIENKEQYTKQWGYELETVNMMTQRRYSQEWREGWEKVDLIRETMRKHPDAEWSVLRNSLCSFAVDQFVLGSGGWISTHGSWSPRTLCKTTSSTSWMPFPTVMPMPTTRLNTALRRQTPTLTKWRLRQMETETPLRST